MIELSGRVCQLLGISRTIGQIYGLLYLSPKPLSLDEIAEYLGVSKSSASVGSRQLLGWRVIRPVWVHRERRDLYEVDPDLGNFIRAGYSEFIKPRLASSQRRLENMSSSLEQDFAEGSLSREEYELCRERLKGLEDIEKKVRALIPLAEKVF